MRFVSHLRNAAVLGLVALLFCVASCGRASTPTSQGKPTATAYCDVLIYNSEETELILRVKQKERIAELVTEPLSKAVQDKNPAAYVVMGTLTLHKDDGSEEMVNIFRPWGHIKKGDAYFVCELDRLRELLKDTLKRASERSE
jgi:hypothetical protein